MRPTDATFSIATTADSTGTFNLNEGGTLQVGGTGGIAIGDGTGVFNFGGGTIEVINSNLTTPVPMPLALNGGTLDLGGFSPTTDKVIFNGGTVINGSLANTSAYEVQTDTLDLDLSGSVALTKSGSGTFILTGTNTYTGGTTINGGILQIASDANLGTAPGSPTPGHLALDGGTLLTTATFTLGPHRGIVLGASGGTLETTGATGLTYDGIIAGDGGLTKSGTGNLTLTGANTYTGHTFINGGTFAVDGTGGSISAAPTTRIHVGLYFNRLETGTGVLNLNNGGTLSITSASGTAAVFNPGDATFNLAGGTLRADASWSSSVDAILSNTSIIDTDSHTVTMHGVFSGTGNLVKAGSGNLILPGTNTYSGDTLITGGTIEFSSFDNFGTGGLILNGGGLRWGSSIGISNSLAFLLGAVDPEVNAHALLPTVNESGGNLVMTFSMRNAAARGDAVLNLQYSSDLGIDDPWSTVPVPETSGNGSGVTFTIIPNGPLHSVTATIAPSDSTNGKLFSRLEGINPSMRVSTHSCAIHVNFRGCRVPGKYQMCAVFVQSGSKFEADSNSAAQNQGFCPVT